MGFFVAALVAAFTVGVILVCSPGADVGKKHQAQRNRQGYNRQSYVQFAFHAAGAYSLCDEVINYLLQIGKNLPM